MSITKFKGVLLHVNGLQVTPCILCRCENIECGVFVEGEEHTILTRKKR
jgi:hypothetical protein